MFYQIYINNYFFFNLLIYLLIIHHVDTFLFSVIMPIYNTGKYLNDSIGSLLNQTIGFEKNIQLILVNDGSTDDSEEMCLKYKNQYFNNIIYVLKKNGGLSSARNIGLDYATGQFINFLDPDDLWSNNTFKYVSKFFKLHPKIDLVAGRMKYFEANEDFHPLDYKFYKSRIIDLREEYKCIHMSVSSCFFRSSAIYTKKFIEGLISGEDTRFVNILLLNKPFMGVLRKALYFYRKRADSSSIVQTSKFNDVFYFITPKLVHHYLLNLSMALYNKALPFIKYYIAYDLLFRIIGQSYKYLNLSKLVKYHQIILKLLKIVDDKFILEQKNVGNIIKFYALSKKHDEDMRNYINFNNGKLSYFGRDIINPKVDKNIIVLKFIEIKNNFLHIEARDNCWLQKEKYYYFCKFGNSIYFPAYRNLEFLDYKTMFGTILKGTIIIFDIRLDENYINQTIQFFFSYKNKTIEIYPSFGYFSHIPPINNGYYINGNFILNYNNSRLKIFANTENLSDYFEIKYCEELEKHDKKEIIQIREKAIKYNKKIKKNEIWLIHDRPNKAGDNGESFFRYLKIKNPCDIQYYFVIKKNNSDYQRLKNLGNVLILGSKKYNLTFLKADKLISSTSNAWVDNPFGEDRKYLVDLFHFDFIFLQHGISKDDVSFFLNKYLKNYTLITTASKKEYKSFLSPNYGYTKQNIKLTGFSRFDGLYINSINRNLENIILIIPTWRMNLKGTVSPITYESTYSDKFIYSEFFLFYNNLINSERLLSSMKLFNYTGIFCLHPSFSAQYIDFCNNSLFSIKKECIYQKVLTQASLLITDYSSVFFDFAYLKKPIIYTQFDYEEYRNNHYKKGYFDYLTNGFGPICFELEKCIDLILDELKNDCRIKNNYLKRINKFFAFFDESNNNRIYQAIRDLSFEKKDISQNENIIIIFIIILCFINNIIIMKKIGKNKIYFFIYILFILNYSFFYN